ncbi:transaldolase family protein [Synechococcus sp. BA-124 BA4]|uniref:transaldolase family protein n=1 Tax=unclassified Synechococcus TaxID=2626047 RepID=UPI0018CF84BB|nr:MULTISPECIES: transaldolase family protein [unclassified Synechococcus]MEA5399323.1 transaldolase family protein [Synechococcus sp. BA-124 BA4]QPN55931.1 transaldolase [Synechococcus sp. CBW1107]CAK6700362.1 Transaldolase [Synechococcus sp. CBW1107]
MSLRFFLDSADPLTWEEWMPCGLFHGITTNPSLLRQAGQDCRIPALRSLTGQALDLGCQELHLQAWGREPEALLDCALALAEMAPGRITVKVPLTRAGTGAAVKVIAQGIPLTFTACYEPPQVLVAAALGARYIAPYLGRIQDLGRDAHQELITMQQCVDRSGSSLRLLVASLRATSDLSRLAAAGMTTFTLSPRLAAALFSCAATEAAAARFEDDADTTLVER